MDKKFYIAKLLRMAKQNLPGRFETLGSARIADLFKNGDRSANFDFFSMDNPYEPPAGTDILERHEVQSAVQRDRFANGYFG